MTVYTFEVRTDTAANWAAINPVLAAGETGRESDTGKVKVGNGVTTWNSLPYGFDMSKVGVQTWRAQNVSGTATAFSTSASPGTPVQLVLPSTVAVPVTIGAICAVTATSAITNLTIQILEVSNGTDTVQSVKNLYGALANGASATLALPAYMLYVPVTGRQRTFNVNVFTSTGGGNVSNTPTIAGATNGFPTVIQAQAAS